MRSLRPPFRYLHIGWALLVLATCIGMALIPGGHPPLLAFVPFVLAAGIFGHALLAIVAWLADRGRRRAGIANDAPSGWPIEAGVLGALTGGLGLAAAAIAVSEISMLRNRAPEWSAIALIALGHLAAFAALILRHRAARGLLAAVAAGWGIALALQLREPRGSGELVFAFGVIAALIAIAAWSLRSRRLGSFLA
jgi:hypothetical protein